MRLLKKNFTIFLVLTLLFAFSCKKPQSRQETIVEPPMDPPLSDIQWEIVLDASLLREPSPNAEKISEVKRNQYVRVLEIRDVPVQSGDNEYVNITWYKIAIEKTGVVGWVNQDAISMMRHSMNWSSDTKEGDALARRIYLDKIFFDKPIKHVRVWDRYYLVVIWTDKTIPMSESIAKDILKTLNKEWEAACASEKGYDEWKHACSREWQNKGRWVIIGWDERGLYRLYLPFGGRTIEPF